MTVRYCLGFAFWNDMVALIEKKKGPRVVVGKLNGIGGKIEPSDPSPKFAMTREFREETGMYVSTDKWRQFANMKIVHYDALVHCFCTHLEGTITGLQQMTDEPVAWYLVNRINLLPVVPNLKWLVPMANDRSEIHAIISDATIYP